MTLLGTPWNPNPAAGEMTADALPADMAVPLPADEHDGTCAH